MNNIVEMDERLFDVWQELLIDNAYDWKEIGISNDCCNTISVPMFGLRLLNWPRHSFEIVDEKKYVLFLLRHQ
jgi:hypothetical protein